MFSFQWPWGALLLPVPWLIWRFYPAKRLPTEQLPHIRLPHLDAVKNAFQTVQGETIPYREWQWRLLLVAWLGLIGALMYPQLLNKHVQVIRSGYDLMLAVDLSGSMEAPDFFTPKGHAISRFEAVKHVLTPFIQRRVGDRIGLVLFADAAYLQSSLTLDNNAVSMLLNKAVLGIVGRNTAIGDAIGLAVKKLRERPQGSRVIILLTDGENNAGTLSPIKAAQLAKQYEIRIYTIGVGSPDTFGRGFDEETLKEVATTTGGEYHAATDLDALSAVYAHIDKTLHKTEAESRSYLERTPLYQFPLGIAMLALLAWQWLFFRTSNS